jgi:hypothetical protein
MACDEDTFPLNCLICLQPQMTLDDLDEHVYETYTNFWRRFQEEIDFMPEFRQCLECQEQGVEHVFCDIGDIMYHIQVVHPEVTSDVSRRLIQYYWES